MKAGFSYFDSCSSENFASAVLCLLLDLDEPGRNAVASLVESVLGPQLRPCGPLLDVARERGLAADGKTLRSDLALRFGAGVILIEVKARTWDVDHVLEQLDRQAASAGPSGCGPPLDVVLLAPTGLAERVRSRTRRPVLRWHDLIAAVDDNPTPLAAAAVQHWRRHVEPTIGIDADFNPLDLDAAVRRVSCLRAFLESCAADVGERPARRKLNLTGADDQPFQSADGAWKWHGLSVPLKGTQGRRIGIYRYVAAPEGSEGALEGLWLELYLDDANRPAMYIPFDAEDLRPATLDALRERFRRAYQGMPR